MMYGQALFGIGGISIVFTEMALADTEERMFPVSKHRSKRIHKKLVKRHGGEFRKEPCMWQSGNTIFAHTKFKAEIERLGKG